MMYNEYTAETSERLAYDPAEISEIRRFWIDFNRIINSDWMKEIALGTLLVGFVLAMVCPSFAPVYLITLAGVGLSLIIGGIVAGSRSSEAGGEFQRGFVEYITETWAPTLTVEMLTAIVTFGITKAVGAIKSAHSVKATQTVKSELTDVGSIVGESEKTISNSTTNVLQFTKDQRAVVDLAKYAKKRGGLSAQDGQTLILWANEYGLSARGPEVHITRGFGSKKHFHIGPVNHIPLLGG